MRTPWTPVRLHSTRDAISHWEVDALSNESILAMSTSERCSLLRRTAGGSVIVVEVDVDVWGAGTRNLQI